MANELTISHSGTAGEAVVSERLPTGVARQDGVASRMPQPAGRKAEIEAIKRTDFDLYQRDFSAEYLQILEDELAEADPDSVTPTRPPTPAQIESTREIFCGSAAGQRLVASWERHGGFKMHVLNVSRTVAEMVRDLGGNREQRAFMERFSRSVSFEAEMAVMDEIASGAPSFVQPASAAEVALFATSPAGKELVPEWGSFAPEMVAQLRFRVARLDEAMDDEDSEEFWTWFNGLDVAVAKSIFRRMVR